MNKSQLWQQVKAYGNPEEFTWDTPKQQMSDLVKQIRSERDFIEFANFASGFVEYQQQSKRKIQKIPTKKRELWEQVKSYGNPEEFTWDTSKQQMYDLVKQIQAESDFIEFANFATGFVEDQERLDFIKMGKEVQEDEDENDKDDGLTFDIQGDGQASEDFDILQDAMEEQIEDLKGRDFPIEWRYITLKRKILRKYLARSKRILNNQLEAIKNENSNFEGRTKIVKGSFQIIKNFDSYVPERKKRVRSKKGQGNDFLNCEIIDNEYIYCPASGRCLIDCLTKNVENFDVETLAPLLEQKEIYRYNIPRCNVRDFCELIGVTFNVYIQSQKKLMYQYEDGQIILCLIDSHWIILKDHKNLKKCYDYAVENIVWTPKKLSECDLDIKEQKPKYRHCEDIEQFEDIWIQDFEAYASQLTGRFFPYASGFCNLQTIYDVVYKKELYKTPQDAVIVKSGQNCIMEMFKFINTQHKKVKKEFISPNGKKMFKMQKRTIYIYAHNSANFDTYFYLNQIGVKCNKMIEKGGIMSLEIECEQFQNVKFVMRDTCKFLAKSLKKLCKSFEIPEEYSKGEMNHNAVNEANWQELKPIWEPYVELDVVALSLVWIKFIQMMRKISPMIDVRQYCSIPQLAYSIACKNQKLPYFTDPLIRKFVQSANRGGRVIARNIKFETKALGAILWNYGVDSIDDLVRKLKPLAKIYEHYNVKRFEDLYQFEDIDEVLKSKGFENIHHLVQLITVTNALIGRDYNIAFDATSLYAAAMALLHSTYLDARNVMVLTDEQCDDFNPDNYRDKKYIIECDLYAPESLQFVPLSVKGKYGAQFATGLLRNIVVNDVDLCECLRFGYVLKCVHEGIYSDPIELPFLRDFVIKYYNERAKVKDVDQVLGDTYKLIPNSAYGKFGQKPCETEIIFTTQKEVDNNSHGIYDEDVVDCQKLGNGQICIRRKKQLSKNTTYSPHHIAGYILAYSKQIMNNFALAIGADKQNIINYMDTDSFYIHYKHFSKLAHIKDELGGGKNDYGDGKMIIKADYLACKSKVCYVYDSKTGILDKKITWKGISREKFEEITQTSVKRIIHDDEDACDYIGGIENWRKSKTQGVSIEKNCSKKLSIKEYQKKYTLVNGVYNFKHLE